MVLVLALAWAKVLGLGPGPGGAPQKAPKSTLVARVPGAGLEIGSVYFN